MLTRGRRRVGGPVTLRIVRNGEFPQKATVKDLGLLKKILAKEDS